MSYQSSITVNPEDVDQYRQYVSTLDIPIQGQDALICIVYSIMSYFVEQAFEVQTDQITLQYIDKTSFNARRGHVMIANHPENQTANARSDGVESDSNP